MWKILAESKLILVSSKLFSLHPTENEAGSKKLFSNGKKWNISWRFLRLFTKWKFSSHFLLTDFPESHESELSEKKIPKSGIPQNNELEEGKVFDLISKIEFCCRSHVCCASQKFLFRKVGKVKNKLDDGFPVRRFEFKPASLRAVNRSFWDLSDLKEFVQKSHEKLHLRDSPFQPYPLPKHPKHFYREDPIFCARKHSASISLLPFES